MKLDELTKLLQSLTGKKDNKNQIRSIAHWLKRVKDAGIYRCYDDPDVASLAKIAEIKLITLAEGEKNERIGTVHAQITESGEQLYKELFRAGYLLKN